ncbi:hypothetical protein ABT340_15710 [Streptosporangium sp. NPDC000239]|uniref:hypothetical protein n=1 Tax=Streptosporangium sp. NPDC000239 TaxID=3154248 RepID=UPI0033311F9B
MGVTPQDIAEFPYIVGYCHYVGSFDHWTADQVRIAREHGAPQNAFRVWIEPVHGRLRVRTIGHCGPELKKALTEHMKRVGLLKGELAVA